MRLRKQEVVKPYFDKNRRFVISVDFRYLLHHCNIEKFIIYSHDLTMRSSKREFRKSPLIGLRTELTGKLLKLFNIENHYLSSRLLLSFLLF